MWVLITFCFLQSHSVLFRSKNKKGKQILGVKGNVEICPSWLSSHPFLLGSCPKPGDSQQSSPLLVCIPLPARVDCFPLNPSCLDQGGRSQVTWLRWAASTQVIKALWKVQEPCTLVSLHAGEGLSGLNLSVKQDCHMGDRSEGVRTR